MHPEDFAIFLNGKQVRLEEIPDGILYDDKGLLDGLEYLYEYDSHNNHDFINSYAMGYSNSYKSYPVKQLSTLNAHLKTGENILTINCKVIPRLSLSWVSSYHFEFFRATDAPKNLISSIELIHHIGENELSSNLEMSEQNLTEGEFYWPHKDLHDSNFVRASVTPKIPQLAQSLIDFREAKVLYLALRLTPIVILLVFTFFFYRRNHNRAVTHSVVALLCIVATWLTLSFDFCVVNHIRQDIGIYNQGFPHFVGIELLLYPLVLPFILLICLFLKNDRRKGKTT